MKIDVNPDWWKTLFDEVYLKTDARSVCDEDITRREVDAVCGLLPLRLDHTIVDLCGGQGRHSLELARRGFEQCTVLDYSHVLLEYGREKAQASGVQVTFVQGDATSTRLPAETYDHVLILGNSLGYMPEDVDDLRIMQEALRLLKPGGYLLVDVTDGAVVRDKFNPNAWHEVEDTIVVCRQRQLTDNFIRAREIVMCKQQGLMRDQSYAIRLYSSKCLEDLVARAGYTKTSIQSGFSSHQKEGDYGFMNHRLLLTAQKPG
jgi:D-alanine-D-alanine ligase